MTNPNTAPSADSDGGAIDDPFSQARLMRWGKALQAEGNSLGDALVAYADSWSQDWAEAVAPEAKPDDKPMLIMTGAQLRAALDFVNPDAGDADQLETEVCIQWGAERTDEDGGTEPAGLRAWLADYPDEGSISLDLWGTEEPTAPPAPLPGKESAFLSAVATIYIDPHDERQELEYIGHIPRGELIRLYKAPNAVHADLLNVAIAVRDACHKAWVTSAENWRADVDVKSIVSAALSSPPAQAAPADYPPLPEADIADEGSNLNEHFSRDALLEYEQAWIDFVAAPPAPPAPLPGKRERALFQAWARDRHWNLSLRADGERYMSESTQEGWYAWKGRAALSAQAAPEDRTGFDEAPSTFNQEDAAPADYPPTVSKEQALEGLNRAIERLQMDIDDGSRPDQWSMQAIQENIRIGRRFIEQSGRSGVSADPLPNRVSLSLGPVAFQFTSHQQWVNKAQSWFANLAAENPNAARKRYLCIDAKGRVCMIGKDFGRARDEDAFPVKLYLIDAAQQHQVKKGELS